jgi:hypothetical protein
VHPFFQALPALVGVLLGATATYFSTAATERARWRRTQSVRWDERRIAAYTEYAHTLKHFIAIAVRIAAYNGLHRQEEPLDPAEGFPLLAAAGDQRTVKWEAVLLLGSPEVIRAARRWHQDAGELQPIVLGQPSDMTWLEAVEAISAARRGFYEAVRHDLGIPLTGSSEVFEWQMSWYLKKAAASSAVAAVEEAE